MPAPEMALAKAAAHAHRIRLGTSVISVPFHHPFHVAERMAFLDHLTRGRAILGVGPCALVTDKNLFGLAMKNSTRCWLSRWTSSYACSSRPSPSTTTALLEDPSNALAAPLLPAAAHAPRDRVVGQPREPRTGRQIRHAVSVARGQKLRNNQTKAEQWNKVEAIARKHGTQTSRDNWRIATCVYLADSREEAWHDVEEKVGRDMQYFFAIGLKAPYESYPGQPAHEITPRSGADRRDWIIGTPDDAIAQIERMQTETGGFGGLMLTTHEWASTEKLRHSMSFSRATSCRTFAAILKDTATSGSAFSKQSRWRQ